MTRSTFGSAVLAAVLAAGFAFGQSFYGSIVGAVNDLSGAAMPGAEVTLVNLGTSERRTMLTDANGGFRFVNLIPGRYRLAVESSGFKRFVREPIDVEVQSVVRVDAAMEIGDVTETVEVTASTPLLQTDDASLGQVVESRKVLETPLNGRNVFNLVALVPGVVPGGDSMRNPNGTNVFAWGNYQIGAGQANQNASFLDGAPINAAYINITALVPTQDAIQEFRVQTNNMGPEFGRFSGGVINLTTKSGTNSFHGSAYEFLRNRVLNANTFFNNAAGVERPAFTQNQFGANVGGPVLRDKLFFFYSFEGYRQRQGQSFLTTVPTEALRRGDFSNLRTSSGALVSIYDPLTICGRLDNAACGTNANGGEALLRSPFPNNVIPDSRIDQAARQFLPLWAPPTTSGAQFTNVNNFTGNASVGGDNDQHNARVDYNVGNKQRLFARYSHWDNTNLPINPYETGTCVDRCTELFNTHQIVLADTYTFNPTTIFDLRLSYLRFHYDRTPLTLGFDLTRLGWPDSLNSEVAFRAQPVANVQGFSEVVGDTGTSSVIQNRNDNYSVAPSLVKIAGRHTIKVGGEFRRLTHNNGQGTFPAGLFNFNTLMTTRNPFSPSGGSGFASFLLGFPANGGGVRTPNLAAGQILYRAAFAGDTWQLNDRITFSYGLRFEQPGPWSERFDRMTVLLPSEEYPLASAVGLPLRGRLGLVNSEFRESRNNTDLHNVLSPRLGLAVRLGPKTVLRTGYGIFWIPNDVSFSQSPNLDIVNTFDTPFIGTLDGSVTQLNILSNPFPDGILQPPGHTPNFHDTFVGQSIRSSLPNDPAGYNQQWNFDVQHELPGSTLLDLAYAGGRGVHLLQYSQELNQLPDEHLGLGAQLQQQVENPFFGHITRGTLAARTVARGQLLRPYPGYTGFAVAGNANRSSIYHALQAKAEKRFGNGGSILAAYSWSKLITDAETLTSWLDQGGGASTQNNNNLQLERSLGNFDVAQRLVVSYVLDLPFGKGKPLLSGVSGAADKLVSGWGVNGVSTFQSGFPLGLGTAVNLTNSFGGGSRPNSSGQSARLDGPAQERLGRWFDTSQFSAPSAFTFGNLSRTVSDLRSHGIANFDFAVFKNTQITEDVGLQFRTEFFDLFNRTQFSFPGRSLGNAQFGVVSGQNNNPRLVQFALRLLF